MKRFFYLTAVLCLAVWAGCSKSDGGNNPVGPGIGTPARIVANDTIPVPAMDDADEPVWGFVTSYAIVLSTANPPNLRVPASQNVPDSVYVQVISNQFDLFIRVEYQDDSLNLLKKHHYVHDSPGRNFTTSTTSYEDQVYIMFSGANDSLWDVWNWRSLETAPAGLAEGFTYYNDTLVRDSGNQVVAIVNSLASFDKPTWVHSTGPAFTGQILYMSDTSSFGNFFSHAWPEGRIVPGYIIDSAVGTRVQQEAYEQSRWDISTVYSYDSSTNRMAVVFRRLLQSKWGDDLDLADSVKVKIGIFDDQSDFKVGGTGRGFTQEFWLIL